MSANVRSRVSVVVVHAGQILAFHGEDPSDHSRYVFLPGGKIEPGETPEAAARRETREETGYEIEVDPHRRWFARYSFFWNGEDVQCETWFYGAVLKDANQIPRPVNDASYHRGVVWVPVAELEAQFGYHPVIREAVQRLRD